MSTKQALETLDWIKEEMARLRRYEEAFQEWNEKTEWIQKSAQSDEIGMHRADVFRKRYSAAMYRIAELEAQAKCHASVSSVSASRKVIFEAEVSLPKIFT